MESSLCLAIGIAEPDGGLPWLPGAINGAREFSEWASRSGYTTDLLTDESGPVTIELLRDRLTALIQANRPVKRLILYFAGHGVARDASEDLWLPSDWHRRQRAIATNVLRRRLERYGIPNLVIVADACRSAAATAESADLTADGVLDLGSEPSAVPDTDVLKGAARFKTAFMIHGSKPKESRCVFSGVLMQALWARDPAAFDPDSPHRVTNASLTKYLRSQVPAVAKRYELELQPEVAVGCIAPDNKYVDLDELDIRPHAPPERPWPSSAPAETRDRPLVGTVDRGATSLGFGVDGPGRGGFSGERRPRRPSRPRLAPAPEEKQSAKLLDRQRTTDADRFWAEYQAEARPDHFETGAGLAIVGGAARRIVVGPTAQAWSEQDGRWWRIGQRLSGMPPDAYQPLMHAVPLLVELEDGRWAAAAAMPGFISTFTIGEGGVASVIQRPVWSADGPPSDTERAVARLRAGAIEAEQALDLAMALRVGKHADPVRGVIAAYLYDAVGDVDSIRRMAAYYVQQRQAIPFDIALLGRLPANAHEGGPLRAEVAPIGAREPRTEAEERLSGFFEAMEGGQAEIAGICPWLRQGWALLDEEPPLIPKALAELAPNLSSAPFTTLGADSGRAMADLVETGRL